MSARVHASEPTTICAARTAMRSLQSPEWECQLARQCLCLRRGLRCFSGAILMRRLSGWLRVPGRDSGWMVVDMRKVARSLWCARSCQSRARQVKHARQRRRSLSFVLPATHAQRPAPSPCAALLAICALQAPSSPCRAQPTITARIPPCKSRARAASFVEAARHSPSPRAPRSTGCQPSPELLTTVSSPRWL